MSRLHAAERSKLRSSSFGLPKERKYPMHDRAHAVNAKARATQQFHAGRLSESSLRQIHSKADRFLKRHAS